MTHSLLSISIPIGTPPFINLTLFLTRTVQNCYQKSSVKMFVKSFGVLSQPLFSEFFALYSNLNVDMVPCFFFLFCLFFSICLKLAVLIWIFVQQSNIQSDYSLALNLDFFFFVRYTWIYRFQFPSHRKTLLTKQLDEKGLVAFPTFSRTFRNFPRSHPLQTQKLAEPLFEKLYTSIFRELDQFTLGESYGVVVQISYMQVTAGCLQCSSIFS